MAERGPRGATRLVDAVDARPRTIARILLLAIGAALVLIAVLLFRDVLAARSSAGERARLFATRDTDAAAAQIDGELEAFAAPVRALAAELSTGTLDRGSVGDAIAGRLAALHNASVFVAALEPDAPSARGAYETRAERRDGHVVLTNRDAPDHFASLAWYAATKASGEAGWAEPLPGGAGTMRAAYAAPFTLPGESAGRPGGVVLGTYEIEHFAYEPAWLNLAGGGYAFVVGNAGTYLDHPLASWVGRPLDPSTTCGTETALASCDQRAAFAAAGTAAAADEPTLIEITDPLTGEPAWLTIAPVPGPDWTFGSVLLERSLLARTANEQRDLVRGGIAALAAAALILLGLLRVDRATTTRLWLASAVIAAAALGGIGWVWYLELTTPAALSTDASGEGFLDQLAPYQGEGVEEIYAGVFVQSIEFTGANDLQLFGHAWQVFRGETAAERGVEPGFTFPEAENVTLVPTFDVITGAGQKLGWDFTLTLREGFDHHQYPFDQDNVRLRMRPREMTVPVLLLPDVPAYELLAPVSLPGVADDIVVEGWRVSESFFSYRLNTYNANFGPLNLTDPGANELMPELYFNVLISRLFINPFVSNMVPLIVVLLLLFAVLMLTTRHEERQKTFGFSTIGVLGYCTGLFFVVILAHNQLRNSLGADHVIYLEQFYFVAYVTLLAVSMNTILFSAGRGGGFIQARDNLIPHLIYWPLVLGTMLALTLVAFD